MILETSGVWDTFGIEKGERARLEPVKVLPRSSRGAASCGWCEIPVA